MLQAGENCGIFSDMTISKGQKVKLLTSRHLVLVAQCRSNYDNFVGENPKT